jgi:hypothetical protein
MLLRSASATTLAGRPCPNWAVRRSQTLYGRPLCSAHLPLSAPGRLRGGRPPGPGEERCTARTTTGHRCRRWAIRAPASGPGPPSGPSGPGPPSGPALCWLHAYPDRNPAITHGATRSLAAFHPLDQAVIHTLIHRGRYLDAAIYLRRLYLAALTAYLLRPDPPSVDKAPAARLVFRHASMLARLLRARHFLGAQHFLDARHSSIPGPPSPPLPDHRPGPVSSPGPLQLHPQLLS